MNEQIVTPCKPGAFFTAVAGIGIGVLTFSFALFLLVGITALMWPSVENTRAAVSMTLFLLLPMGVASAVVWAYFR